MLVNTELRFIGSIKTPYSSLDECPNNVQPEGPLCEISLSDEFKDGISGLEVGQRILVLYWFEHVDRGATIQESGNSEAMVGTFALRSPHRPNPIAAAVLTIESIDGGVISVKGLDCLNGTHLLDIRPAIECTISS